MTSIPLRVSRAHTATVKRLGARWDRIERQWYLPPNLDAAPFTPWLPPTIPQGGPRAAIDAVLLPTRCYRCGTATAAVAGLLFDVADVHANEYTMLAENGRRFLAYDARSADVIATACPDALLAECGAGPLRWRTTRVCPDGYLANTCRRCGTVLGNWPLHEDLAEYRAEGGHLRDLPRIGTDIASAALHWLRDRELRGQHAMTPDHDKRASRPADASTSPQRMRWLRSTAVAVAMLLAAMTSCGGESEPAGQPSASMSASTTTPVASSTPPGDDTSITEIVDGDTVWVENDLKVRLIGIDTPETRDPRQPVECYGHEATQRITELVPPATPVRLVYDADRFDQYGRTLAYVYRLADGLFVNAELLRGGFASTLTVPPNVMHSDEFVAIERDAGNAGRGMWSACEDAKPDASAVALGSLPSRNSRVTSADQHPGQSHDSSSALRRIGRNEAVRHDTERRLWARPSSLRQCRYGAGGPEVRGTRSVWRPARWLRGMETAAVGPQPHGHAEGNSIERKFDVR